MVADLEDTRVPVLARSALQGLVDQLRDTERRVEELDARLAKQAREDKVCQRLTTIPGIGPITATALTATVGDATVFASGRHLAAWLGLVPRQNSSGGRGAPGRHLQGGRRLSPPPAGAWRAGGDALARQDFALAGRAAEAPPLQRRGGGVANKLARIAWAVMARGEDYRKPDAAAELAQG